MRNPELLTKIDELKERFAKPAFDTDLKQIDSWVAEAKRLLLIDSLMNHDGVKFLLEHLAKDVRQMDELLLNANSSQLSDRDRDRVLDRKALYKHFLRFFVSTEEALERLTGRVDAELENVKKSA